MVTPSNRSFVEVLLRLRFAAANPQRARLDGYRQPSGYTTVEVSDLVDLLYHFDRLDHDLRARADGT